MRWYAYGVVLCRFGGTGRLLIPIHTTQWLAKHDSGLLCLRNIKVLCVSHQVLGWLQGGGYRLQPPRYMDVVRRRGHSTCTHEGGTEFGLGTKSEKVGYACNAFSLIFGTKYLVTKFVPN